MHSAYYPDFSAQFENNENDDTVFGTISDEGMNVIDNKRRESDDTYNGHLSDIIVTSVVIQG